MSNLTDRARSRLADASANYLDRQTKFTPPDNIAYYQGYDAATGKHKVRTPKGDVLYCFSNSTGVYAKGDKVALNQVSGGASPVIDAMPR